MSPATMNRPLPTPEPAVPRSDSAAGGAAALRSGRRGTSLRFYICLGLLATTAVGIQVVAVSLGQVLRKKAIPLQRPLAEADARKLAPDYGLHPQPPLPINHEMLDTLGTEEYLSWRVVDHRVGKESPVCLAHVFVTYYTGKPDMVPHVPDECYVAGGAVAAGDPITIDVPVKGVRAPRDRVPVRAVAFQPKPSLHDVLGTNRDTVNVLYFFLTNGKYVTTRDQVRLAQANLFERYSYYAKIEIQFSDYNETRKAGAEQSIAAAGPLLSKLLPILLEDHLPDWDAVTHRH
jgi:hypothetical protein